MTAYHIAMLLTSYCDYVRSNLVLSGLISALSYLLQASILSAHNLGQCIWFIGSAGKVPTAVL